MHHGGSARLFAPSRGGARSNPESPAERGSAASCTHVRTHAYTHADAHCAHVYTHSYTRVDAHVRCANVCAHVCMHVYTDVYVSVYTRAFPAPEARTSDRAPIAPEKYKQLRCNW